MLVIKKFIVLQVLKYFRVKIMKSLLDSMM